MLLVSLICACTRDVIPAKFAEIPQSTWNFDSIVEFSFEIEAPVSQQCNVITFIRNDKTYSYQNFWFYVEKVYPDSTVSCDTIECYLADQRGRWLGSGLRNVLEMPVLIEQNADFTQTGTYTYKLRHAMRDDLLRGIHSLGIKIEKQ